MDYLWIKALHIVAVLIWVSGTLLVAVTLSSISPNGEGTADVSRSRSLEVVKRWDRWLTTPAMLVLWVLGISLAIEGDWFSQPWLSVKIALVLLLSSLHGYLSGSLRKISAGNSINSAKTYGLVAKLIIVLVAIAILLVVKKPFGS